MSQNNGSNNTSLRLKTGLAEMLKGGVIMDVTNAEQATIADLNFDMESLRVADSGTIDALRSLGYAK